MKKCPYCAEEIQDAAIICRYCGRDQPQPTNTILTSDPVSNTIPVAAPVLPPASTFPEPAPAGKKAKKHRPIFYVIAILSLCMLCFIFSMALNPSSKSQTNSTDKAHKATLDAIVTETSPTKVIEAKTVITPTHTLAPKPTVVEPTATLSKPTATLPKPTATTTAPVANAAVQVYVNKVQELSLSCMTYLDKISKQSAAAGEDATLIFDSTWKADTAVALVGMKASCAAMDEINPVPEMFKSTQSYMNTAADEFDLVVQYYSEGVDEVSGEKLGKAVNHMEKGMLYVQLATAELKKLK